MTGRGSERILLLIEWLAEQTEPVTLSEAVTALDLPKSSALGLLRMLVDLGYVQRMEAVRYRLIRLPGEAGAQRSAWGTLLRLVGDSVQTAVDEAGESGFIAVFDELGAVRYLNKVMPKREIRYDRDITVARQPHQVTSGMVLLGGLDDAALEAYARTAIAEGRLSQPAEAFIHGVRAVEARGHAVNPRGVVEGAAGVAAPIFDSDGHLVAALNIAGPADRFASNLDRIIDITRLRAKDATTALMRFRNDVRKPGQR